MSDNEEMSWDAVINETESPAQTNNEFVVLPDGVYKYTVKKVTNRRYQPKPGKTSGITIPCAEKMVELLFEGANGNSWVYNSFYAHKSSMGIIISFFRSCGLIPENEQVNQVMPWDEIIGKTGWAKIVVDNFNPEKPRNRVKVWVAPSKAPAEDDEAF